jgi:hypothetical protein
MKLWLSLLLYVLAITTYGQTAPLPTDPANGKVVYTGGILTPRGATTEQVYDKAKKWMAGTVSQFQEDPATQVFSGIGYVDVWDIRYPFKLRVNVTDSGTYYRIDDITWQIMDKTPVETGTIEELCDRKQVAIGKGTRTKSIADMDKKIKSYTRGLGKEIFQLLQ